MNAFVPENARIRIWREQSTGRIMLVENNIDPVTTVEIVDVPDSKAMVTVDEEIEGTMPYTSRFVDPVKRS